MQSPTPVVCKHPRLQDHTSPLQVLQVASGDFLAQGASPLPPLFTAHMKAGAASRGPRQVNSSRNHCRPQTSTPSICAGEVKPALQTKTALPCCTVTALATREHKSGLTKSKCVAPSGVQPPRATVALTTADATSRSHCLGGWKEARVSGYSVALPVT